MNKKENKKIKVLVYGDSPACSTGFAQVIRGIFNRLGKSGKYDIDIIGINDRGGWKDPEQYPYRIFPAASPVATGTDYHGRPKLLATLLGKDPDIVHKPWDIVFLLNDPFILEQPVEIFGKGALDVISQIQQQFNQKLPPEYKFKTVYYIPVDSPLKPNWIEKSIALSDYPIAYTEYARREIEKADNELSTPTQVPLRTEIIYHGVDMNVFRPLPEEERQDFRDHFFSGKVNKETFVVIVVARNQLRKDLPRTMQIFKEFQKRRPDSFLYIHAQLHDAWGSLLEYGKQFGLEYGKDWGAPARFNANTGYSLEMVNNLYNAADCVLSTTLGEGFGFYNLEGFATKKVVLAPNNTVHPEIFGYNPKDDLDIDKLCTTVRGIPLKCQSNLSEWATYGPGDMERVRPLVNTEDAVKKLIWVYDNPDKVQQIVDRAYEWVKDYTWDKVAVQWDALFTRVVKQLEYERAEARKQGPVQGSVPEPAALQMG